MLNAIEKFYKPLKAKKVIYNGADSSKYYSDIKENYIFCMGRLWDEAKNIGLVIEASAKIHYPIYIAGRMDNQGVHRISKNVFFIGQIPPDEVACWLAKAAIYLLPVKYEPFGYTFLEAAFSGCAIVTGRIPSMKEIWKNSCIYADTENSNELATTINSLMSDTGRRQQLAEKAMKRAISRYKCEKMTSEYILLYRRMHEMKVKRNLKFQEL
jgi:glycosyltransferase involved in cell wall biosynthesis